MSAHTGRCFRQLRRTRERKLTQGKSWDFAIRQRVPLLLRPFLTGDYRQTRAGADVMNLAVTRYAQHQILVENRKQASQRGR